MIKLNIIWIGVYRQGLVTGQRVMRTDREADIATHETLGMMVGARWRFTLGGNMVFWWEEPTDAQKCAVQRFLENRNVTLPLLHTTMEIESLKYIAHGGARPVMFNT